MTYEKPPIDVPRLIEDLRLESADFQLPILKKLPDEIRVPSESLIKTSTVELTLGILCPQRSFNVLGRKAESGVPEQPIGRQSIDGVLNRLRYGMLSEAIAAHDEPAVPVAWFAVENGAFRVHSSQGRTQPAHIKDVLLFTGGADLTTEYDMTSSYADRAVAAVSVPGYPTIVEISPTSESVEFPWEATWLTYCLDGGFDKNTIGSKLVEMGVVADKQNPHAELTQYRESGPLSRQDQMARALIRALMRMRY